MTFDLMIYTSFHTALSMVALVTGLWLLIGLSLESPLLALDAAVILTLLVTSVTGFFGFPFTKVLPSHVVGILLLLVLAIVVWARYVRNLEGSAGFVYCVSLTVAVYLDAFVAVVQAFLKVPALHAIAPTQQSPGFMAAQAMLLLVFIVLGIAAVRGIRRSHPLIQPARYSN